MNAKTISLGILHAVAVIFGILFLMWFLYQIQSVLVYIAFASVISLIGRPLVRVLKRKLKFNTTLAAITTLLIILIFFLGIFLLFVPIVTEQSQLIESIDISKIGTELDQLNQEVSDYFNVKKLSFVELINRSDLKQFFDVAAIPKVVNSFLSGFGSVLIGLFSVLFMAFFLLKDSLLLEKSLLVFAKTKDEHKFARIFNKIKDLLSRYFIGLLLQIAILFVLYTAVLLIFGVHNAIAVALIAAILNLIPYVGPLFGVILILVLAITSHLGMDFQQVILPKLIYLILGCLGIQLIDNFLNQPLIFGNSVKSHPLEIFIAILIFGLLFGVHGLIVAVPTYTAIKVIAKEFLSEYKIVKKLTKDL